MESCPRCGSREREWRNLGKSREGDPFERCDHGWHDEPKEDTVWRDVHDTAAERLKNPDPQTVPAEDVVGPLDEVSHSNDIRRHGYDPDKPARSSEVSLTLTREEAEKGLARHITLSDVDVGDCPANRFEAKLRAALEERE